MKFTKLVAASLLAMAAVPSTAYAQAAADVGATVGAMVYGPDGSEVGKIDSISGGNIIVDTGTNKAALPANSFAKGSKGPRIGYTKQQLDDAIKQANQQSAAQLQTALTAGAAVYAADGVQVGTVKQVKPDGSVVLTGQNGEFALPKDQFHMGAKGVSVAYTSADLAKALKPDPEDVAALNAALVTGAALYSSDGVQVGTVKEIQADGSVVIDHDASALALPKNQFKLADNGHLALRVTAAQLDAALKQSAGGAGTSSTANSGS
ncbi:MAG TPA: hypothetical protein VF418_05660 [Sphingomonadaceae bacterium]